MFKNKKSKLLKYNLLRKHLKFSNATKQKSIEKNDANKIQSHLRFFDLPVLPAHGALLIAVVRFDPLEYAVHVKHVRTYSPHCDK